MGANLVYLDRPNTQKHNVAGESKLGYKYALSSMQGWRLSMEDAHICNENIDGSGIGLFAIFDGHGGIEAAKFAERHFTKALLANPNFSKKQYPLALEETFLEIDNLIIANMAEMHAISREYPPNMTPLKRASQM